MIGVKLPIHKSSKSLLIFLNEDNFIIMSEKNIYLTNPVFIPVINTFKKTVKKTYLPMGDYKIFVYLSPG